MTAPTPVQAASEAIESAPIGAPVTLPYSQAVALWSTLAAVTAERDQARQVLADAWDEGFQFGWHSTELRTDGNPYREAGL